jgi:hypothetical protein
MKTIVLGLILFAAVSMGLKIGQSCKSQGGFTVVAFNVAPWPPKACSPQALTVNGFFTQNHCPTSIRITELFNGRQSYTQYISLTGCYVPGQNVTFNYPFNPYQCSSGRYDIQFDLLQETPQSDLACWNYQYQL